jgi:hypothetical protein
MSAAQALTHPALWSPEETCKFVCLLIDESHMSSKDPSIQIPSRDLMFKLFTALDKYKVSEAIIPRCIVDQDVSCEGLLHLNWRHRVSFLYGESVYGQSLEAAISACNGSNKDQDFGQKPSKIFLLWRNLFAHLEIDFASKIPRIHRLNEVMKNAFPNLLLVTYHICLTQGFVKFCLDQQQQLKFLLPHQSVDGYVHLSDKKKSALPALPPAHLCTLGVDKHTVRPLKEKPMSAAAAILTPADIWDRSHDSDGKVISCF